MPSYMWKHDFTKKTQATVDSAQNETLLDNPEPTETSPQRIVKLTVVRTILQVASSVSLPWNIRGMVVNDSVTPTDTDPSDFDDELHYTFMHAAEQITMWDFKSKRNINPGEIYNLQVIKKDTAVSADIFIASHLLYFINR